MKHNYKYAPPSISNKGKEILRNLTADGFAVVCQENYIPDEWSGHDEINLMKVCHTYNFSFARLLLPLSKPQEDGTTHLSVFVIANCCKQNPSVVHKDGELKSFALSLCHPSGLDCIYIKEKDTDGVYLNPRGQKIGDNRFDACLSWGNDDTVYCLPVPDYPTRVRRGWYGEVFLDVKDQD